MITKGTRLQYIDIAKGILILFLLCGHSILYTRMLGYDDDSISLWNKLVPWYNAFFMPAFFIITGFCSSYTINFKEYLWKNIKSLLIPAVLIVTSSQYIMDLCLHNELTLKHVTDLFFWMLDKGPWFIIALFWCKLIYWFLYKLSLKRQLFIIGIVFFVGLILTRLKNIPNVQYHIHVMLLLPYLAFGAYLKNQKELLDKCLKPIALFGCFSVSVQWILGVLWGGVQNALYRSICKYFYMDIPYTYRQ